MRHGQNEFGSIKRQKTHGLIPAAFTPMDDKGKLVLDRVEPYADYPTKSRVAGVDCDPVRLPLKRLSRPDLARMKADLRKIGFFEKCLA